MSLAKELESLTWQVMPHVQHNVSLITKLEQLKDKVAELEARLADSEVKKGTK